MINKTDKVPVEGHKNSREEFDALVKNIPTIGDTLYAPDWNANCVNVCAMGGEISCKAYGMAHVNTCLGDDGAIKAWVNAKILPYKAGFRWFLSGDYQQGLRCYLSKRAITFLLSKNARLDLLHVHKVRVIDQVTRDATKYLVVDIA